MFSESIEINDRSIQFLSYRLSWRKRSENFFCLGRHTDKHTKLSYKMLGKKRHLLDDLAKVTQDYFRVTTLLKTNYHKSVGLQPRLLIKIIFTKVNIQLFLTLFFSWCLSIILVPSFMVVSLLGPGLILPLPSHSPWPCRGGGGWFSWFTSW